MISLPSSTKLPFNAPKHLVSTHGKMLLRELRDTTVNINVVKDCIQKDPVAGRYRDPNSKENAFHALLNGNFSKKFILEILDLLLKTCPKGAEETDIHGALPLHTALSQLNVIDEAVFKLLEVYPLGAKVALPAYVLIPLFLAVMRDDSSLAIVKALVDAFPDGPGTRNRTQSYPIHFACKRVRPNLPVIRLLIDAYPRALSAINAYGWHPLHCLCYVSDSYEAARMLHEACPDSVAVQDRQGRTCLHLAVLLVGRDHQNAIAREEEMIRFEREQELLSFQAHNQGGAHSQAQSQKVVKANTSHEEDDNEGGDDEGDTSSALIDPKMKSLDMVNDTVEAGSKSRRLICFLISAYPTALVMNNNFEATPVETVLEKARKTQSKFKKVIVWGLFDDPITARLLLLAHRRLGVARAVPTIRPSHQRHLFELNWQCRKTALWVSYGGQSSASLSHELSALSISSAAAAAKNSGKAAVAGKKGNHTNKYNKNSKTLSHNTQKDGKVVHTGVSSGMVNILAELRNHGKDDCLKLIFSWI